MARTFAVCLLLLAALQSHAAAQGLETKANQIRAAMDARDFERAEASVRELKAADPSAFVHNNYDYLLARLAQRRGARTEATSLYLGIVSRNSILARYALWHLSEIARAAMDPGLERHYISRLLAEFPSSTLWRRARDRMIDNRFESGDYRGSIAMLRPSASTSGASGRSAMASLGEAYAKLGDTPTARSTFDQLVAGARDDSALRAAEGLDALDHKAGMKASEFEALRRARIYLSNRHWPEARAHLLLIVDSFPESPNRAEALYQTGFTFYREDKYDDAIKWFERAHSEFPAKKDGEQGYYYVGTALQKARRYPEAARRYMDFITAYPDSDLLEGAYRNVVDSLRYARKDEEAIEWSRRIAVRFSGKPLAVAGLFNEAKIEIGRGRFDAAEQLLLKLQAQPIYPRMVSAPIRGEASFLRAYAIEQMGRIGEAARLYLAIPDERENYFGYRATLRLRALAATDEGRRVIQPLARGYREQARAAFSGGRWSEAKDAATQALRLNEEAAGQRELMEVLRATYSRLAAYSSVWNYRLIPAGRSVLAGSGAANSANSATSLAAELLFLGLYDEGAPELRLTGFESAGKPDLIVESVGPQSALRAPTAFGGRDTAFSLAVYSNRGDQSQHAIRFAEPVFRSVPQDFRVDLLPRDLAELMYPAPYRDSFARYAPKNGVDPRLVLALARQESRFDPSVKSAEAARGLLQFITETALETAREEGLDKFELDDVYDPQIAVRLAVRHVADLFKLFPNNPYAVIASYNTGAQNVERWIFRSRTSDVDRIVAEIAIPETKDYVAKVMNNYRAYQALYDQDLKPLR
ncbi:MAG TPA: transglycosylase SLT domain-containing protein [Blastocatellia bacterium]|jgi:soluble lytic murein transglycosylase|nr:transglycosylase SLT domain-containing protein [Blastocatellia bacterium]